MIDPGRHCLNLSLASIDIDPKDAPRDLAAVKQKKTWPKSSPLLRQRWPNHRPTEDLRWARPHGTSEGSGQESIDASEDESTSTQWDVPEDKYLLESTRQRATRKLGEASQQRFDARPIVINCRDDSALDRLVAAIKGEDGREPLFAEYCRAVDAAEDAESKSKSEAECFDIFCRKANIGGTILVGEGYKNLFKYNASQPLARNPEVVLDTAHRADDWDDTGYDATPNLLLLDKGDPRGDIEFGFEEESQYQKRHQETTWREVIGAGAVRREQTSDMSTVGKDATPALQLLKSLVRSGIWALCQGVSIWYLIMILFSVLSPLFQTTLARNHPITGRSCGFTLCGRFLRMFVSDSLSFATTLLCDLADPDHAPDIAKIIAFFTGPKKHIIDTFEPPKKSFKIRPPGSDVTEEWHWSNSPESPENTPLPNPPWKMLEVRNELWGRRTAVFAGYARKGNEGPETAIPIVMKCAWLPAYLKDYESSILEHIQSALQESDNREKYPFLADAMQYVDPRVIQYIPRSLGALQDCDRVS
jgi:hypothetical protein